MPDKLKPTQFKKGVPRHPNAGRRAGTPNVTTRLVREAIVEAAAQHGDDGRGKDGLIGCCKYICREKPWSIRWSSREGSNGTGAVAA